MEVVINPTCYIQSRQYLSILAGSLPHADSIQTNNNAPVNITLNEHRSTYEITSYKITGPYSTRNRTAAIKNIHLTLFCKTINIHIVRLALLFFQYFHPICSKTS